MQIMVVIPTCRGALCFTRQAYQSIFACNIRYNETDMSLSSCAQTLLKNIFFCMLILLSTVENPSQIKCRSSHNYNLFMTSRQGKIESAKYGRNKKSVMEAIDEQNQKARVIRDYQRELRRVVAKVSVETRSGYGGHGTQLGPVTPTAVLNSRPGYHAV